MAMPSQLTVERLAPETSNINDHDTLFTISVITTADIDPFNLLEGQGAVISCPSCHPVTDFVDHRLYQLYPFPGSATATSRR